MRKVSPTHIWGPVLILGAVAALGILFFPLGKSGEAALNSKFIEKVGEGFIAPACGSSTSGTTCNGSTPSVTFNWTNDNPDFAEGNSTVIYVNGSVVGSGLDPSSGSYIWGGAVSNTNYNYEIHYHSADFGIDHFDLSNSGSFTTPNCAPTTGTIQGYKVLMPGNNQTAVPPANETVTLSNSANTLYKASTDFSSTQGQRHWYYLESNGNQMVYDLLDDPLTGYDTSNSWRGLEVFSPPRVNWNRLWASKGHPERNMDAVRRWVAPSPGTIHITGNASDGFPTGDGVIIFIKKNNAILWQGIVENGNTAGISYDINTPVSSNDNIDFVINKRGNNIGDVTNFDPSIDFVSDASTNSNPYVFNSVSSGNHNVSVSVPAGWSVGYTLCYNDTTCHNNAPTLGNSVSVSVPAGGFADLWWHFTSSAPLFDYSLSNSGASEVIKTSGDAFTTNTITKTLTSGTTESVTLSLSGVPGGVSYTITHNPGDPANPCNPADCQSVINFTVTPSTPVGTHPITVTGSPLDRETKFNLVVSGNPMTVTCSASPTTAFLGETITWTAVVVSGGVSPFTYSWSGTNFPTTPPPDTDLFSTSYSTIGQKTANVIVTDSSSPTPQQASCSVPIPIVRINFDPDLEEF